MDSMINRGPYGEWHYEGIPCEVCRKGRKD